MNNSLNENLLSRLENISFAASGCGLDFHNVKCANEDICKVSAFLKITPEQTFLFSCFIDLSFQKAVNLETLSKHLKCSVIKLITFMNEIEALERKGFIQKRIRRIGRKYSFSDLSYCVPHYVIEALRKTDSSMLEATKFDLPGFLNQISDIVDERNDNSLTTEHLISETEFLISNNRRLPFVSFVDRNLTQTLSKCTVFALSYVRLKGQRSVDIDSFASSLFDDLGQQLEFTHHINTGNHELIKKEFLKIFTSEFDGDKSVGLSHRTAKLLYHDYPALVETEQKDVGLIRFGTVQEKKLFFDEDISKQIESLEAVMKPSRFRKYRRELKLNGLSGGITAIFFGAPGTGKTEAVYQIARKTGRDMMMVDLSQTRSKWFGESEKQVKKIFEDYTTLMKNSDNEPILFINEADGLFSRRFEMSGGSSSEYTINMMQNILLQALESFEGILIATTNLTGNLDKAFERRFTYKIQFPRPDCRVRQMIWKNRLPDLTLEEAAELSDRFEITGGEIDIQIRQLIMQKVLKGKLNLFEVLCNGCNKTQGFMVRRKIGF